MRLNDSVKRGAKHRLRGFTPRNMVAPYEDQHLLEAVEDGEPHETYIATHQKPFDDLRISIIELSGKVV